MMGPWMFLLLTLPLNPSSRHRTPAEGCGLLSDSMPGPLDTRHLTTEDIPLLGTVAPVIWALPGHILRGGMKAVALGALMTHSLRGLTTLGPVGLRAVDRPITTWRSESTVPDTWLMVL